MMTTNAVLLSYFCFCCFFIMRCENSLRFLLCSELRLQICDLQLSGIRRLFSRPYLSNGLAIGMVVVVSPPVRPFDGLSRMYCG